MSDASPRRLRGAQRAAWAHEDPSFVDHDDPLHDVNEEPAEGSTGAARVMRVVESQEDETEPDDSTDTDEEADTSVGLDVSPEPVPPPRPLAPPTPIVVARKRVRPAHWGWRGALNRSSLGLLRLMPGPMEQRLLDEEHLVRQSTWSRPINIAIASPKSSAKTSTAVSLGGRLAQIKGGHVVVWEGTDAEGTLAERTEGFQREGVAELTAAAETVRTPGALQRFVTDQSSYAQVLGSSGKRVLSGEHVESIQTVLEHTHRIIITDTGNVPHSDVFSAVLERADVLVIPVVPRADVVNLARSLVYDLVSSPKTADLAKRAVLVNVDDGRAPTSGLNAEIVEERFAELGVETAVRVPFDKAIGDGGPITVNDFSRDSIVAWTDVAAAVVSAVAVTAE